MSRALVTGITGQDGHYLGELLLSGGYEVVGVVRRGSVARVPDARIRVVEGDLHDPDSLCRAVREVAPDELYHLASPTFVPASWEDPAGTLVAVAGGTAALLAAAAALERPPRIIVASSSEIFGNAGVSPQDESAPMRPRSPYGAAKLAAHALVGAYRERHGLHASSAILYNHESPRRPTSFLPRKVTRGAAAIKLGLERELVLGDLDAVRDWSHARDVVRGLVLMAGAPGPGDYVLASGVGRTVGDVVDVAFACVGLDPAEHVRVDPALVRPPDPVPVVGDATRAREQLGWSTQTSFAGMIEEMVQADLAALGSVRH